MSFDTIEIETRDRVRFITLSRPRVLNAMNRQCVLECGQAVRAAELDPNIRVIVFKGAGDRAFTAGADITELRGYGPIEIMEYNRDWLDLFRRVEICRKPVVAAVHGWATGGGTELCLSCDFVICAESAKLGLAEINIGVIPGAGAGVRLTRWLGRLKAKELLMLGRILGGREAVEWELANRCVADDALAGEVDALCAELVHRAPLALAAAKASINTGAEASIDVAMEYELQEFARLFATADQREGMSAFIEKRKPTYQGK